MDNFCTAKVAFWLTAHRHFLINKRKPTIGFLKQNKVAFYGKRGDRQWLRTAVGGFGGALRR
jgi:hypothetical protein